MDYTKEERTTMLEAITSTLRRLAKAAAKHGWAAILKAGESDEQVAVLIKIVRDGGTMGYPIILTFGMRGGNERLEAMFDLMGLRGEKRDWAKARCLMFVELGLDAEKPAWASRAAYEVMSRYSDKQLEALASKVDAGMGFEDTAVDPTDEIGGVLSSLERVNRRQWGQDCIGWILGEDRETPKTILAAKTTTKPAAAPPKPKSLLDDEETPPPAKATPPAPAKPASLVDEEDFPPPAKILPPAKPASLLDDDASPAAPAAAKGNGAEDENSIAAVAKKAGLEDVYSKLLTAPAKRKGSAEKVLARFAGIAAGTETPDSIRKSAEAILR